MGIKLELSEWVDQKESLGKNLSNNLEYVLVIENKG
jgi:hypothetical protein